LPHPHAAAFVLARSICSADHCSRPTLSLLWRLGRAREVEQGVNGHARRIAAARGDDLSSRERQVALLAVDGLTAREIGEQLFISRRTVETHLANVYTKLGVRSKIELARRASELALNQ
jgi:DNA-binding NarL/FixJ family response regulator